MTREYMRILVADLPDYERAGWSAVERDGALAGTGIHGGQVLVCLVWRAVL